MKRLQDKVAIVTGGANGIGRVACLRMAQQGATVAIWDMDKARGEALQQELQALELDAFFMPVDTTDSAAVEAAAAAVAQRCGRIDILVNNAGITRDASLRKMTDQQWQQVIDVNLSGVFYCTRAATAYMLERGYGRIITTASVVGLYGNFGQTNYVATKAGVIGMTKTWARELGRKGITANAVAPGFIETEMTAKIPEAVLSGITAKIPMGCMGTPEDIANAYIFLASDEARYINGAVLSVDGGMVG